MKEEMRRFLCLLLCVLMLGTFMPGSSANEVFEPAEGNSGGCDIYVLLNPEIAGEVTGEGTYAPGASVTLTPTANQGFVFLWWEEDGEFLSSAVPLTFTAETSRELSAVFDTAVTVLWLDGDESVLDSQVYAFWSLTDGEVTPSTDAQPSKAADDDYTYSFTGWNEGDWDETETDMFFIFTPNFDPTPIVKHTLTILYQYEDGTQAAPTHTALLAEDAEYAVDSPLVSGFIPDQETVAGAMGEKDVTVTVTYTALTYAATVENGSGSGDYAAGETVTIVADDPEEGAQFKEWTTQDDLAIDSPTSAETFFIMPDYAVTVTATYEDIPVTTYAVTVVNGTGSGDYEEGETVTIVADAPEDGQQFVEWATQDDIAFVSADGLEASFIMPDYAVTVTATYEDIPVPTYAVTVVNGEGDGGYEEGATVSISADAPAQGRRFKEWTTQDGVAFDNAASAETSFVMPAKHVIVAATYETIPTHTVTFDGNGGAPETANVAVPDGEHVQRPSDPTRQGYIFRYWMADDGHEFDFDKTITNSITLYAQWVEGNSKPSQSENGGNAGWNPVPATAPAGTAAAETSVQAETSVKADGSTETKQLETSTETKTNDDGSVTVTDTVKETVKTENGNGSIEVTTETEKTETTASTVNDDGSVTDTTKVTCTETVTVKFADANGRVSTAETKTEQEKSTDVTATENEDGTVTEKTETKETVKVTEKVTDDRGNVTEVVTETTREETVQLTFREDGSATGTSTATSVVKDEQGNVLSTAVTESKIEISTSDDGTKTTQTEATVTTTDADGNVTTEKTFATENQRADGSTGTLVKDELGNVLSQETSISQEEFEKAIAENRPIQAPLTVNPDSLTAGGELPPIKVSLPPSAYDKDGDGKVSPGERPRLEIQVTAGSSSVIVAEVGPDGTLRIKKDCYEGSIIVPVNGSCEFVVIDNAKTFADVSESAWYCEYVTFVTAREIMDEAEEGLFAPDAPMTRAQLAQMLYGFDPSAKAGNGAAFGDVAADDWFCGAVGWVSENGFLEGANGSFRPLDAVTCEEMMACLCRWAEYAGYDVSAAAGSDGSSGAMRWAAALGLIGGSDDGIQDPAAGITRAQAAAIMTRFVRSAR